MRRLCKSAVLGLLVALGSLGASAARADTIPLRKDVFCDDGDYLGTIKIDIAKNSDNPATTGNPPVFDPTRRLVGFEIQGGFDKNPYNPCPTSNYRWIQVYKGEPTLYSWEDKDKFSYDRTRSDADDKKIADGSPFYVNARGPAYDHDLGYRDLPRDYLSLTDTGTQDVQFTFETALVCFATGSNDIHVIDGFTWTFGYHHNVGGGADYSVDAPTLTGGIHFADIKSAWDNDPDPGTLKNSWNLIDGGCCCVPLPTSAYMGVPLLVLTFGFRRRIAALAA